MQSNHFIAINIIECPSERAATPTGPSLSGPRPSSRGPRKNSNSTPKPRRNRRCPPKEELGSDKIRTKVSGDAKLVNG